MAKESQLVAPIAREDARGMGLHLPVHFGLWASRWYYVPTVFVMCVIFAGFFVRVDSHAGRYPSDPPYLRSTILLASVRNWNFALYNTMPMLMSLLFWHSLARAKDVADEVFKEEVRADAAAVHAVRTSFGCVYVHALFLSICAALLYASAFSLDQIVTEYGLLWGFGLPIGFALITISLRNLAVALIRREGSDTETYVSTHIRPRVLATITWQLVSFVVALELALKEPLGTLSPVGDLPKVQALGARGYGHIDGYRGYPTESQCALDVNATYVANYCARVLSSENALWSNTYRSNPTPALKYGSYVADSGWLQCDDGGFGVYVSMYDACIVRILVEGALNSRLHSILWASLIPLIAVVLREIITSLDESLMWSAFFIPRLDVPKKSGRRRSRLLILAAALSTVGLTCVPIIWAIKVVFLKGMISSHFYMVPHLLASLLLAFHAAAMERRLKDAERRDEFCRQFAEDAPTFYFFRADRLKQMKETDKFMRMQDQLNEDKDKDESERCLRRLRVPLVHAFGPKGYAEDEQDQVPLSEVLFVSHCWEKRDEPDPNGIQLKAIKEHLNDRGNIKYVWYDFACMPQAERTPEETARFRLMLGAITYLYLTAQVLLLVDSQYTRRFWPLVEAWCSMQTCTKHGLKHDDTVIPRCQTKRIHNARDDHEQDLRDNASLSPDGFRTKLLAPDIYVTNQKDKDTTMLKLKGIDQKVINLNTLAAEINGDMALHQQV